MLRTALAFLLGSSRRSLAVCGSVVLSLATLLSLPVAVGAQQAASVTSDQLRAFQPRMIGPAVTGGRVHDVEALAGDPSTLYVATASGGLWKTTNRGHTWTNVFDTMAVSTFGDVAIAPSNPEVVYAGTGEQNNRQSTSWGNGVYRSDDGGETWRHLGLVESRHIGKIRIHPADPDVVYVAALGNLWAPGGERGVYRSTDGGRTWERVLAGENEWTGAVDLVMSPEDPDVLYAAMYQRLRRTWGFNGGGPGSGIWKTTDGGETWRELTNGLPAGDMGRIGLAIARSNPRVLNALVQHAEDEGTYRTTDAGETWRKMSDRDPRPMYYSHIFIDPNDPDVVYSLATRSAVSDDGGRSWTDISARHTYDVGVHSDHHTMWIDPSDSEHFYLAGDAGLHETYDRGVNYRKINNFPIGQFYAIGVDMRDPYWVYGGMQDNHSWMAPSETRRWIGIVNDDWQQIGFGDGMYWQPDPSNFRYTYGNAQNGGYVRLDPLTGERIEIEPLEPEDEDYRWDWVSPSLVSRHDPHTVYVGGNRLFISTNHGLSWERTPDLTRAIDRDTLELMGVRGADITLSRNDGTSSFGEATTIAESPLDADVVWVGTDDGNVQVSTDGGSTWTEVGRNVRGVEDGTYVSRVAASAAGREVAYATFDAHRRGDFRPYVFRTTDLGRSWEPLHSSLPDDAGSVNVIVEHPDDPDVLFLGTEHHLYASTDRGATWSEMPNLPTTAYDDLVVHPREKDLVIGTHGRSIWILDDTRALAEWDAGVASSPAHLFTAGPGTLFLYRKDTSYRGQAEFAGENPVDGVLLTYHLGSGSDQARIRITGPGGEEVRVLEVPSGPGMHRINWDLRHDLDDEPDTWEPWEDPHLPRSTETRGPFVSPGTYTVTLEARGTRTSRPVEVRGDPLSDRTVAQYQHRERFLLRLLELQDEIRAAIVDAGGDPDRGGFFRGGGEQDDPVSRLRGLSSQVRRLYGAIEGGGVQPTTLDPPTLTQEEALERVEARLAEIRAEIR